MNWKLHNGHLGLDFLLRPTKHFCLPTAFTSISPSLSSFRCIRVFNESICICWLASAVAAAPLSSGELVQKDSAQTPPLDFQVLTSRFFFFSFFFLYVALKRVWKTRSATMQRRFEPLLFFLIGKNGCDR